MAQPRQNPLADAQSILGAENQTNVLEKANNAGIINASTTFDNSDPQEKPKPVDVVLKFKKGWTDGQKAQAIEKRKQLSAAYTTNTKITKRNNQHLFLSNTKLTGKQNCGQ